MRFQRLFSSTSSLLYWILLVYPSRFVLRHKRSSLRYQAHKNCTIQKQIENLCVEREWRKERKWTTRKKFSIESLTGRTVSVVVGEMKIFCQLRKGFLLFFSLSLSAPFHFLHLDQAAMEHEERQKKSFIWLKKSHSNYCISFFSSSSHSFCLAEVSALFYSSPCRVSFALCKENDKLPSQNDGSC